MDNKDKAIGVFDSGLGGISVLKEFVKSIGEPAFRGSQIYSWIYKGAKL